jgi:hypothetical protein
MAVYFPTIDTLRLAVTNAAVPADVSLASVAAAFVDGGVWIESSVALPKGAVNQHRRLGVQFNKEGQPTQLESYQCWPQLLSLERVDPTAGITDQTPVLFELHPASLLAEVAGEMLRLGNDRQSFRWLTSGEGEMDTVFLRVLGPPYYTLLRAFERDGDSQAPRAYVERASGIWVEIGHTHPLLAQLKPPEGQCLLLRSPRVWTALATGPFRDIYEILEFPLPTQPVHWRETEPPQRLKVHLQLVPANTDESAELWVLRDRGFEQIDELVRTADDALIGRLSFAVAEEGTRTTVVLRARPSRQEPPVLVLLGQSFRPYLKLSNLFLPCGTRLKPPLRRDTVRQLLADDPDRVTWLYPTTEGQFTPESLPDSSFRPLSDWVDYVLHHEQVALQQWIEATTFEFEPFICKDEERDTAKAKKKEPRDKRSSSEDVASGATTDLPPIKKGKKPPTVPEDVLPALPVAAPSDLQKHLQELEQHFLSLEGPIDTRERKAMWPEMAMVNAALGHVGDAALCWLQALWAPSQHTATWAQFWSRAEKPADITPLFAKPEPTAAEVRSVAAWLTAAGHRGDVPARLPLGDVLRFLEKHEALLPVRAVWLAAISAFRLSHGDVLGLTRTRDRLLERLFQTGLTHDQDLPSFLRFSGMSGNERQRAFREWLLELPTRMAHWVDSHRAISEPEPRHTIAYGQLMLAFGLARLGEDAAARHLATAAKAWLSEFEGMEKDVHQVLMEAFHFRIQQALEGKPAAGPLPVELLEYAEQLDFLPRYKVDNLRMRSRILEPHEKIKAYRHAFLALPDFDKALHQLTDLLDRTALEKECQRLLAAARDPHQRFRAVLAALNVAPRIGEAFAAGLLAQVPAVCTEPVDVIEQARLLEQALFTAAHFNHGEAVQTILALFHQRLASEKLVAARDRLEPLAGQVFRGLRKLGMQDDIRRLLDALTEVVTRGKPFAGLRQATNWPKLVRILLQVAAGHFYVNNEAEGRALVEEGRLLLLHGELQGRDQSELASAYVAALGQAPVGLALPAIDELLAKLDRVYDNFTTYTHYSASKLEVIEAIVMTVVTEEFAMGQVGRRLLEDDEFLVRQRIHRDVEEAYASIESR